LEEIQLRIMGWQGVQYKPSFTINVFRQQVGSEQATGTAMLVYLQDRH
jgi:hypothetical protein